MATDLNRGSLRRGHYAGVRGNASQSKSSPQALVYQPIRPASNWNCSLMLQPSSLFCSCAGDVPSSISGSDYLAASRLLFNASQACVSFPLSTSVHWPTYTFTAHPIPTTYVPPGDPDEPTDMPPHYPVHSRTRTAARQLWEPIRGERQLTFDLLIGDSYLDASESLFARRRRVDLNLDWRHDSEAWSVARGCSLFDDRCA